MLVDLHCHIYPVYNLPKVVESVGQAGGGQGLLLFLTERSDCDFFESFQTAKITLPNIQVKPISPNLLALGNKIFLMRGRQYSCLEGIEVLALGDGVDLPDRLPAIEYCRALKDSEALVAFSWAFGKWRGFRASLIKELALDLGKEKAVLLDSRLRPKFLKLPKVFAELKAQGFRILAGSDPLPLKNQECKLGSFGVRLNLNENLPSETIIKQAILKQDFEFYGERCSSLEFIQDQVCLRLAKK